MCDKFVKRRLSVKPIITVEHLRKVYRVGDERVIALNDINLAIGKG